MVVIHGLGGVPEPKPDRAAKVRGERDGQTDGTSAAKGSAGTGNGDELKISSEAQAAAEITRLLSISETQVEIRADRVAAAKDAIARGEYKNPDVVAKVAQKVSKYLP